MQVKFTINKCIATTRSVFYIECGLAFLARYSNEIWELEYDLATFYLLSKKGILRKLFKFIKEALDLE